MIRSSQPKRAGFTLLELLTVLTIISLLVSLLLPAVMDSLESSRSVRCKANLKQIGVALMAFEGARGRLPSNYGDECVWPGLSPSAQIYPFLTGDESLAELLDNRCRYGGSGQFHKIDDPNAPSVLHCPSDGGAYATATSYRFNDSLYRPNRIGPFSFWASRDHRRGVELAKIVDGLAKTAFASERTVYRLGETRQDDALFQMRSGDLGCRELNQDPTAPLLQESAGTSWTRSSQLHAKYSHAWPPNVAWRDCALVQENHAWVFARSRHRGHVNVLMGDGAVDSASNFIDFAVWRALGSMHGNESVSQQVQP